MTRIINSDTPAKKRNSVLKLLVNLKPVIQFKKPANESRNDVIAFIILSLEEIEKTINDTIRSWEKRGYWVKVEHFVNEWKWVTDIKEGIIQSETAKGWTKWPNVMEGLFSHLAEVRPTRKKLGEFWKGSYKVYLKNK